jgi:hypothetical protein
MLYDLELSSYDLEIYFISDLSLRSDKQMSPRLAASSAQPYRPRSLIGPHLTLNYLLVTLNYLHLTLTCDLLFQIFNDFCQSLVLFDLGKLSCVLELSSFNLELSSCDLEL